MHAKSKLFIIGGAEDKGTRDEKKFSRQGILKKIVEESAAQSKSRFAVLTTATSAPEEAAQNYIEAFAKLGVGDVKVLDIRTREDANEENNIEILNDCDVLFVTGGNQMRLTSILGGSNFFSALANRVQNDENFIYAGTSAGAAAASDSMICGGSGKDAILKGEVRTSTGFGFVEDMVFDTHFVKRGRIGRLFQIIVSNPKILGIGLEENTALLIQGGVMEVVGSGMAIVVDGRFIKQSNLIEIRDGAPLSIENLTLHVITEGDTFDVSTHQMTIQALQQ